MIEHIRNIDLKESDVPTNLTNWVEIEEFALSFNGYEELGSFEKCAEIANAQRHETLTNLRTCLFFEQRRWRHFGETPDVNAMEYIREILEKIRCKVINGDLT
jgi:hypothetical protein